MDAALKPLSNSIKHWAEVDRPRERMMDKGQDALSDAELIAILIQSGNKEKSAVDLAREVLRLGSNNLTQLGKLHYKEFQKVKGIGEAKAVTLAAALELGRRRQLSEVLPQKIIDRSAAAAAILMPLMGDLAHEKFCVLYLSISNRLIHYEFVSSGGLTSTTVDLKMIFKIAIQQLASRIILAHNHPSGNLKPSQSDKLITAKIREAAALMEINVADHLIIAGNKYLSFADEGLL